MRKMLKGLIKRARGMEDWRDSQFEDWKTRGLEGWQFNVSQFKLNFTNIAFLNSHTSIPLSLHTSKRRYAFTMAEILVSLTIIGIIAAITLPSLVGNIKEKSWATQRKALYSRMSQAISMLPSLNGYGVSENETETANNAAQAFISNGLSKVLEINNICDNQNLNKCGFSDKIKTLHNSKMNFPTNFSELNRRIIEPDAVTYGEVQYVNSSPIMNTNVAGFETQNGESIAVYYNPYCTSNTKYEDFSPVQPLICANFIYDLNGKKGPNQVGKDIGFMTALYSTDSEVISPSMPITFSDSAHDVQEAKNLCRKKNARLQNFEELISYTVNLKLLDISTAYGQVSSTVLNENKNLGLSLYYNVMSSHTRARGYINCVRRD